MEEIKKIRLKLAQYQAGGEVALRSTPCVTCTGTGVAGSEGTTIEEAAPPADAEDAGAAVGVGDVVTTAVTARVPVGIGATARLVLRTIQRHAPDGEIVARSAVDVLGAVVAVVEGRAVRRHARIEGPVVVIDDARIILGQALDDVAVEIEQ